MKRSTSALWHNLESQSVRRDGRKQRVPSAELVPGDVVVLQSGDSVPADLRFIKVRSLQVEEAALTGESVAAQKCVEVLPATQLLSTYAPFMNRLFHSAPISGLAWLKIICIGAVVFGTIEFKKWSDARRQARVAT